MKLVLIKTFIENWKRKLFSIVFAIFIWLLVDQSLTTTRTLFNVPVRIINIPHTRTIEGIQSNGRINKKINLTLVGNKETLDSLQTNDIEVVLDAMGKADEWPALITKKNLVSQNPELDIASSISKVFHPTFVVRLSKLITEKIPIIVTHPSGEAPRGYQFLDVWPYNLELSVSGPEEVLKKVRNREVSLTFNLGDISKKQLDALAKDSSLDRCNVLSFFVPESWKFIQIPHLSDIPMIINDPQCKNLRIDFIKCETLPLDKKIPVQFFFNPEQLDRINPQIIKVSSGGALKETNGIYLLDTPLYTSGTDRLFLDIVRDKIQIVVIVSSGKEGKKLSWSLQFLNAQELEDCYVERLTADTVDSDIKLMLHSQREEYLRNRFRSYVNRMRLHHPDGTKLKLNFDIADRHIVAHFTPPLMDQINNNLETAYAGEK